MSWRHLILYIHPSIQGKGTLFRNIQKTGRWHYSALGSRQGSNVLVGSYVLICLPSWLYLSIYLSIIFSTFNLFISIPIYLHTHINASMYMYIYLYIYIYIFVYISINPSIFYIYLFINILFFYLTIYLSCLLILQFHYQTIYQLFKSICISNYLLYTYYLCN